MYARIGRKEEITKAIQANKFKLEHKSKLARDEQDVQMCVE